MALVISSLAAVVVAGIFYAYRGYTKRQAQRGGPVSASD
jgi:hypothetical protein